MLPNALILPHFDCMCVMWYPNLDQKYKNKLQVLQNTSVFVSAYNWTRERTSELSILTRLTGFQQTKDSNSVFLQAFLKSSLKCILNQGFSQALFDVVIHHFPNPCEFPNYIQICFESYHSNSGQLFYVTWESFLFKKALLRCFTCMLYFINFSILS